MFENEGNESEVASEPIETPEAPAPEPASQGPVDLDSVEKFRFGGKEWTPKEFQGAYMMQADYTRKTQQLAEERKYYDNLSVDLNAVKGNPSLEAKFREVYPAKFHAYLDYVAQKKEPGAAQNQYANIDPAYMQRFNALEADMNTRKVEAINAELDARFKSLSEKYPLADEEAAIARAQSLHAQGVKLTDQVWDKIWKAVSDKNEIVFKKYGTAQVDKQKNANQRGKDVAPGGGIPGQTPPKKPRTIKEAQALALEEFMNS